jgi:hypothetical protein
MRRVPGAGLRKRIPFDIFPWPSEIYMNCLDQGSQEYGELKKRKRKKKAFLFSLASKLLILRNEFGCI